MKSIKLTEKVIESSDMLLSVTDHTAYGYAFIEKHAHCILDRRDAFIKSGIKNKKVFKA